MKMTEAIKGFAVTLFILVSSFQSRAMEAVDKTTAAAAAGADRQDEVSKTLRGSDCYGDYEATYTTPRDVVVEALIGRGSYGSVAKAKINGKLVAIKQCSPSASELKAQYREVVALCLMEHPNVVTILKVGIRRSPTGLELYLTTGFMDTDLANVIGSIGGTHQPFSSLRSRRIIFQMVSGVTYLHSQGIVHRDLKPANVLINADCTLKITDLGAVELVRPGLHNDLVTTRWYRSPEGVAGSGLISELQHPEAVDLWALGVMLVEVMSWQAGHHLFTGSDAFDMVKRHKQFFSQERRKSAAGHSSSIQILENYFLEQLPRGASTTEKLSKFIGGAYRAEDSEGFAQLLALANSLLRLDPADRISAADCQAAACFHELGVENVAVKLSEMDRCDLRRLLSEGVTCELEFIRLADEAWGIRKRANRRADD